MKYILLAMLSFSVFSINLDSLERRGYQIQQIEQGQSFDQLAKILHGEPANKLHSFENFKELLTEWNPHLKGLENHSGQYLYTSYPYAPNMWYKWAPDLSQKEAVAINDVRYDEFDAAMGVRTPQIETNTDDMKKVVERSKWVGFAHVTISQGQFQDSIGDNKINSEQNSPFTVGAGIVFLPKSMPSYSIATSAYYSDLTSSNVNDASGTVENEGVEIPAEIGGNLYLQKNLSGFFANIYGGLDHERFNTFNFEQIISGETVQLQIEKQVINYATLGVGFRFELYQPVTLKLSISQGLTSATDLQGTKFMLYFNQKLSKRFWYHFIFKNHMLESKSRKTTISRYGFGLGTSF